MNKREKFLLDCIIELLDEIMECDDLSELETKEEEMDELLLELRNERKVSRL